MGKPLDSFKTLHEKRLHRKLMQILNDPTHPTRHYFDSRLTEPRVKTKLYNSLYLFSGVKIFHSTGVEDFYSREQIQTVIKLRFYPQLCQFVMKIIPVIN